MKPKPLSVSFLITPFIRVEISELRQRGDEIRLISTDGVIDNKSIARDGGFVKFTEIAGGWGALARQSTRDGRAGGLRIVRVEQDDAVNVDTQRRLVVHDPILGGALHGEGFPLHLESFPDLFGQNIAVRTTPILAGQNETFLILTVLELHNFVIADEVLAAAAVEVNLPALEIDVVDRGNDHAHGFVL